MQYVTSRKAITSLVKLAALQLMLPSAGPEIGGRERGGEREGGLGGRHCGSFAFVSVIAQAWGGDERESWREAGARGECETSAVKSAPAPPAPSAGCSQPRSDHPFPRASGEIAARDGTGRASATEDTAARACELPSLPASTRGERLA